MQGTRSAIGVSFARVARARLALVVLGALLLAGCHSWFWERNEDFCCVDPDRCHEYGAPGPTACTKAGEVCDLPNNRCIVAECMGDGQCTDPSKPACAGGRCVACDEPSHVCAASAPVCSATNECEACTDEASCSRFGDTPHCGTSGACVACRQASNDCTTATAPTCDSTSNTCRACRVGECGTGACDTTSGRCIAETEIAYVNGATGSGSACTSAAPCKTIALGVAAIAGARKYVVVAAGAYTESVSIDGKVLTLLGAGASLQPGALGEAGVVVLNGSTVVIEGLHVHDAGGGANGDGIRCAVVTTGSPSLTVQDATIDGCSGSGIDAASCAVTVDHSSIAGNTAGGVVVSSGSSTSVRRSTISGNPGGGVSVSGGQATLTNNMIDRNGGLSSTVGNVKVDSVTALSFSFNTVGDGAVSSAAFAAGVQCSAVNPVTLSSSIVFGGAANQVSATNCSFAYSVSNQALTGSNNLTTTDPKFVNPTQNDYHIQTSSPAVAAADPAAAVTSDIDGDTRPAPAGTRADCGADEVSQ